MLDRKSEQESERRGERVRPPEPAPPLQFGTQAWASAMGNATVARIARRAAEPAQDEELEPEADEPGAMAATEAEAAEPEGEGPEDASAAAEAVDALPEDQLPE